MNWYEVAQHCSTKRLSSKLAIFNIETAGVVFTEDLFAEPGADDQFTTSDIPGFLKAASARAALDAEAKVASAHIQVVEWHKNQSSPALPKGWNRLCPRHPEAVQEKDDPRMVCCLGLSRGLLLGAGRAYRRGALSRAGGLAERSRPRPRRRAGNQDTPAPTPIRSPRRARRT